jgi:hypothetical protein
MYSESDKTFYQIKHVLENFKLSGYIFGQTDRIEREREYWVTGELFQALRSEFHQYDEELWVDNALSTIKPDITVVNSNRKYIFEIKRASQWSSIDRLPDQLERYSGMDNFKRGYVVVVNDCSPDGENKDIIDQIKKKAQRSNTDLSNWEIWVLNEDDAIWETGKPRASAENEPLKLE